MSQDASREVSCDDWVSKLAWDAWQSMPPPWDSDPQKMSRQFTLFNDLPAELRDNIWEMAFCDFTEPLLVHIDASRDSDVQPTLGHQSSPTYTIDALRTEGVTMPAADIAMVCHEALRAYKRVRRSRHTDYTFGQGKTEVRFTITPSSILFFSTPRTAIAVGRMLETQGRPKNRAWLSTTGNLGRDGKTPLSYTPA